MGVASPYQSRKPLEYWLDGLKANELVALWVFLSGNPDLFNEELPTPKEVKKLLYSESLPSYFYACKDRGDPPSTEARRESR